MLKPPTVTSCCVKTCLHNFRNWLGESAGLFFWILYLHHMQVSIAIKHVYVCACNHGFATEFPFYSRRAFPFFRRTCVLAGAHTLTNYHIDAYTISYARTLTYSCQLSLTHTRYALVQEGRFLARVKLVER